jgi:hypothetical protein
MKLEFYGRHEGVHKQTRGAAEAMLADEITVSAPRASRLGSAQATKARGKRADTVTSSATHFPGTEGNQEG